MSSFAAQVLSEAGQQNKGTGHTSKPLNPVRRDKKLRRNGQPEQLSKVSLVLGRQLLHQGRICLDGGLELLVRHGRLWLCWLRSWSGCGCGRSGLSVAAVRGGLRARVQERVRGFEKPSGFIKTRPTLTFFAATDPLEWEPLRLWLVDGSTRAYAIVGGAPGAGFGGRGRRWHVPRQCPQIHLNDSSE